NDLRIPPAMVRHLIEAYTRESGVRSLDKKIASLVRGYAKLKALEEPYEVQVDQESTARILGVRQFEPELYENNHHAGVVTGLAWTSSGGDILYIESSLSQGKGRMNITGNLGEVMKESASIALAYIRSHAGDWNIKPELFEHSDIHIHVPEGATPKDGPSAGITMLTSLLSTYTQRKIRKKLAMTGEITLRGKVLPVGGIKEKILAAKRAGISEIILCKGNRKDVEEIKQAYLSDMTFHYVDRMEEVVSLALLKETIPNRKDYSRFYPGTNPA
ncbi:MAG: endopeptidase La, partial [Sphingomonadales bacterium]|nr:endopeptidase La [Sphingomonadales bacterium]